MAELINDCFDIMNGRVRAKSITKATWKRDREVYIFFKRWIIIAAACHIFFLFTETWRVTWGSVWFRVALWQNERMPLCLWYNVGSFANDSYQHNWAHSPFTIRHGLRICTHWKIQPRLCGSKHYFHWTIKNAIIFNFVVLICRDFLGSFDPQVVVKKIQQSDHF